MTKNTDRQQVAVLMNPAEKKLVAEARGLTGEKQSEFIRDAAVDRALKILAKDNWRRRESTRKIP